MACGGLVNGGNPSYCLKIGHFGYTRQKKQGIVVYLTQILNKKPDDEGL